MSWGFILTCGVIKLFGWTIWLNSSIWWWGPIESISPKSLSYLCCCDTIELPSISLWESPNSSKLSISYGEPVMYEWTLAGECICIESISLWSANWLVKALLWCDESRGNVGGIMCWCETSAMWAPLEYMLRCWVVGLYEAPRGDIIDCFSKALLDISDPNLAAFKLTFSCSDKADVAVTDEAADESDAAEALDVLDAKLAANFVSVFKSVDATIELDSDIADVDDASEPEFKIDFLAPKTLSAIELKPAKVLALELNRFEPPEPVNSLRLEAKESDLITFSLVVDEIRLSAADFRASEVSELVILAAEPSVAMLLDWVMSFDTNDRDAVEVSLNASDPNWLTREAALANWFADETTFSCDAVSILLPPKIPLAWLETPPEPRELIMFESANWSRIADPFLTFETSALGSLSWSRDPIILASECGNRLAVGRMRKLLELTKFWA